MKDYIDVIEPKTGQHILVDYFSGTFPFICYEDDLELAVMEDTLNEFASFFNYSKEEIIKNEYSSNRFLYQYTIGEEITIRFMGPELKSGRQSCMIELKGKGCREFENKTNKSWKEFLEYFVIMHNVKPTRIDLVIDDYDGTIIHQKEVYKLVDAGYYTSVFRSEPKIIDNKTGGFTIQFGEHKSPQMLVIYDKLKEQRKKKQPVNQKYWCRYEMRFTHQKANDIAFNIIDTPTEEYPKFIYGLLYSMLDLKEVNTYSQESQYKVATHPKWLKFLNNYEKAIITKYDANKKTYENYIKYCQPILALYMFSSIIYNNYNIHQTITDLLELTYSYMDNINKQKVQKINNYLKQSINKLVTENDIYEVKELLNKEILDRGLPF